MADEKPSNRQAGGTSAGPVGQGPAGAPPSHGDKPRPTAPAGVLGTPAASKGQEAGATKVPRSVFAQTIVGITGQNAAEEESSRESARPLPPPVQVQAAAGGHAEIEPLRVPSERPAPKPYAGAGATRGGRALGAAGLTTPMPSSATAPGNRSEERLIAVRQDAPTNPDHALPRASQPKPPGPAKADVTRPLAGSGSPVPAAPPGYKPVITTVQPASAPAPGARASARPAPAPRSPAAANTPAPRVAASPAARKENTSEPLVLSLDERDDLEGASISAPVSRRTPLILLGFALLAVIALIAWMLQPAATPPSAELPTRNSAELAAPTAPAQPSAPVPPAQPEQPATAAPTPAPPVEPAASKAASPEPKAEASEEETEPARAATAEPKRAAAKAKKAKPRKQVVLLKDDPPVLRVERNDESSSTDDLVERAARAAQAAEAEESGASASERNAPPPPPEPD